MSAQHTPGPWRAANDCGDSGHPAVYTAEGLKVALVIGSPNRSRNSADANARLIAAAPEMLAALKSLQASWWILIETFVVPAATEYQQRLRLFEARAAIAKAEGRAE